MQRPHRTPACPLERCDVTRAAYHLIDTHGARAAAVAEQRARTAGTETGALTWMRIARALRDIQDSAATAHRPAE
jgi:hypothetical protein